MLAPRASELLLDLADNNGDPCEICDATEHTDCPGCGFPLESIEALCIECQEGV